MSYCPNCGKEIKNKKNKDIKAIEKKAGYNNYSQRSYSNLSDLFTQKQTSSHVIRNFLWICRCSQFLSR